MKARSNFVLAFLGLSLVASPAAAHFPWLDVNADGKAILFFGENPADRTYPLPESIAKATVQATGKKKEKTPLRMTGVETDDFVGLVSSDPVAANATLHSRVTYGLFRGSRLDYYAAHRGGKMPTSLDASKKEPAPPLDLNARLVDTDSGVDVYVSWKGKPLAGVEVKLYCDDGHEEGAAKTDEQGKVSFTDREVEDGLNGIMVGHTVEDEGQLDGQAYKATSHYLTVTFYDPQSAKPPKNKSSKKTS